MSSVLTKSDPKTRKSALLAAGERLDRLMTVECRPLDGGLPTGLVVPMYEVCRNKAKMPLSALAAQKLIESVSYGDRVLIATGAGAPPQLPHGETDGPPGAAVLARALALGLGAEVTVVSEEVHCGAVEAAVSVANGWSEGPRNVAVASVAPGKRKGPLAVSDLFDRTRPTAVVFVELDGPNEQGRFHGVRGNRRPPDYSANLHLLAPLATKAGVLTVGIGDGGNEVGFGTFRNDLARIHPNPHVVTATGTDVVVSAAVSNWGAYAVAGALAVALDDMNLVHQPESELALISACVAEGARDGATSLSKPYVDGISWRGHCGFVSLVASIVASTTTQTAPLSTSESRD